MADKPIKELIDTHKNFPTNIQYLVRVATSKVMETAKYENRLKDPAVPLSEIFEGQGMHFEGIGSEKSIVVIPEFNSGASAVYDQFLTAAEASGLNLHVFGSTIGGEFTDHLRSGKVSAIATEYLDPVFERHFRSVTNDNLPQIISPYVSSQELVEVLS